MARAEEMLGRDDDDEMSADERALDRLLATTRELVIEWCAADCFVHIAEDAIERRDVVDTVVRAATATAAAGQHPHDERAPLRRTLEQRWRTSTPVVVGQLVGTATFLSSSDDPPPACVLRRFARRLARRSGTFVPRVEPAAMPLRRPARGRLEGTNVRVGEAANQNDEKAEATMRRFIVLARRAETSTEGLFAATLDVLRLAPASSRCPAIGCDVSDLVADAISLDEARALAGGVALAAEQTTVPRVACDPAIIFGLLSNLVSNAVTHTPPGGRVSVDVHADAGFVHATIADTGIGMTRAARTHLFETTVRVGRAPLPVSSLPLTVGKAYLEAHGGALNVASAPGRGTSVTLVMPIGRDRRG